MTTMSGACRDADQGWLVHGAAHDLGNMLQVTASALRIARRRSRDGLTRDLDEILADAERSLDRAITLGGRLAVGAGAGMPPSPIRVRDVLETLHAMMRYRLADSIGIATLVAEELPMLFCSADQLEGALLNLAVNAAEAMPTGGALRLDARECTDRHACPSLCGGCVAISVIDTGPGIPPHLRETLGEVGVSSKRERPGHGLGLAGVRRFLELCGGELEIDSRADRGTNMRLHLPVAPR